MTTHLKNGAASSQNYLPVPQHRWSNGVKVLAAHGMLVLIRHAGFANLRRTDLALSCAAAAASNVDLFSDDRLSASAGQLSKYNISYNA